MWLRENGVVRAALCIASALLVGACALDRHGDVPPPVATEPGACMQDVSLDGTSTAAPTPIGPLTLDASGSTICLHLDATRNIADAHFVALSDMLAGDTSGVLAVLQDPDRVTLQDSWDVSIGSAPAQTHMTLEWNAPLHEVTEAVLWVRAGNASAIATTIQLALFEPLD